MLRTMAEENRRRSARHLVGVATELHVGTRTVLAVVRDISRHGLGLVVPSDLVAAIGDVSWVVVDTVSSYAITGVVTRFEEGVLGLELEEILNGQPLERIERLPLTEDMPPSETED